MDLYYGIALSLHLGLSGEYNFLHPHIGINYNNFMAGVYYNSEFDFSIYAGYEFYIGEDTNLELGLVTGYKVNDVVPMIKINHNNFFVSPGSDGKHIGIVTGIDWRF
jgi:hypothetical protein